MGLLDGLTILYLEDHHDTREAMTIGLDRLGARVIGTDSAQVALLLAQQHRPDLIVADLELADPELDGWKFMQAVRALAAEREKRTPAIALSVHNEAADRLKSLSAGFTLHVAKPLTPDELAGRIALLVKPVSGTS
jgi:CheY-like chemotaxis protein